MYQVSCKYNMMIRAILLNDRDVVHSIVLSGYNINEKDDTGRTPLHVAARHGSDKVIETLIYYGADINIRDDHGHRAVEIALMHGHIRVWRSINLSQSIHSREKTVKPAIRRIQIGDFANHYSTATNSADSIRSAHLHAH